MMKRQKKSKTKAAVKKQKAIFKVAKLEIIKKSHQAKLKGGSDGVATLEVDIM